MQLCLNVRILIPISLHLFFSARLICKLTVLYFVKKKMCNQMLREIHNMWEKIGIAES